jgi:hypothetical protein
MAQRGGPLRLTSCYFAPRQVLQLLALCTRSNNLKDLEPGDVVTVTGYRAKSGALFLWVTELSSSNGMKLRGA